MNFFNPAIFMPKVATGYVGPGDVLGSANVYCGLRAYTAASIGSNVVTIKRSSDNTSKTFVSIAGGGINTADVFFDGSTYTATTLYDQSGNGNDCTNTLSPPLFSLTGGSGGKPCLSFDPAGSMFLTKAPGATLLGGQPNSASVVINNTGGAGNVGIWAMNDNAGGNTAYNSVGIDSTVGFVYLYAGSVGQAACSAAAWHAVQGLFNTTSSEIMVDGTAVTGLNAGTQPGGGGQLVLGAATNTPVNLYKGLFVEGIWWHGDKSASFAALTSNQRAYWGF